MTPDAVLARLQAQGISLRRDGEKLIAKPREALTDELRALILDHKAELLEAVEPPAGTLQALAIHAGNYACDGCRNIRMVEEYRGASRRRFWWTCTRGFPILEVAYLGERVLLAPAACNSFDPSARH